jgi:hypothetical protein
VCRPFINAYWGWAGYFSSMEQTRFYDAYTYTNPEVVVANYYVAALVLGLHAVAGAVLVWWGCRQRRWTA